MSKKSPTDFPPVIFIRRFSAQDQRINRNKENSNSENDTYKYAQWDKPTVIRHFHHHSFLKINNQIYSPIKSVSAFRSKAASTAS